MYEILPHTADVRIRLENTSLESLFDDAARAIVAFSEITTMPHAVEERNLIVDSVDPATLLVDFLNEILTLLHVGRLAFDGFRSITIAPASLRARVRLLAVETWTEDIKAVTYHEASVTSDGELWRAGIVLDI
jgi:SHS2 domain-containing protein